LPINN